MELLLTGRGTSITDRLRGVVDHKLGRLERIEPRLTRVEVEVISEKNPRQGGAHRVEAVAETARKKYRARADAHEVETAIDAVAEKLERQIRDHHEKRRTTRRATGAGAKSGATAPEQAERRR